MPEQNFSDEQIQSLVRDLDSLQSGPTVSAALIGCGRRAIPFLRSYLLQGKPRGIYQPRQLAVETLAELGAKDVLLEYLEQPMQCKDAVVRFGEDAVKSTAARELGQFLTDDVFERLQKLALDHLLPGLVETLGVFGRTEAMPYLLWALGDDVCRLPAEEAIRKLGANALPFVIDATDEAYPSRDEETPSSLQRRRSALRILLDLRVSEADWLRLKPLLEETDPEIVMTASRIALNVAQAPDQHRAVHRLIEMLPSANWLLRTEARTALAEHFDMARKTIDEEIARRSTVGSREQVMDVVLRLLLNLRGQIVKAGLGPL